MSYTLGEAAKAVGKSKPTLSKAVKSGKISAQKNEDGSYTIDPAELHRVYPPTLSETVTRERLETPSVTPVNTEETRELIELRVKLQAAQERISDLQEDRDHWRQQANRLLSSSSPATPSRDDAPKGFWKRLLG